LKVNLSAITYGSSIGKQQMDGTAADAAAANEHDDIALLLRSVCYAMWV
jgi:hypothetical protein